MRGRIMYANAYEVEIHGNFHVAADPDADHETVRKATLGLLKERLHSGLREVTAEPDLRAVGVGREGVKLRIEVNGETDD